MADFIFSIFTSLVFLFFCFLLSLTTPLLIPSLFSPLFLNLISKPLCIDETAKPVGTDHEDEVEEIVTESQQVSHAIDGRVPVPKLYMEMDPDHKDIEIDNRDASLSVAGVYATHKRFRDTFDWKGVSKKPSDIWEQDAPVPFPDVGLLQFLPVVEWLDSPILERIPKPASTLGELLAAERNSAFVEDNTEYEMMRKFKNGSLCCFKIMPLTPKMMKLKRLPKISKVVKRVMSCW